MANENGDNSPRPAFRESELLPAMMAITLAVAAQLALNDGLTLLGVAGYIVAAWLFVSSVRGLFDRAPDRAAAGETAIAEPEAAAVAPRQPVASANRLAYLRRNWRLVTLAEIFRGDIPPARLEGLEPAFPPETGPADQPEVEEALVAPGDESPVTAARLESWAASESPESAPRAVKVTPQGDVLVLDIGLEQVQRFDAAGKLLATYQLAGLAGLEVLDLAVSPDGRTLYIVDAASKRLQVINLTGDELPGEEE